MSVEVDSRSTNIGGLNPSTIFSAGDTVKLLEYHTQDVSNIKFDISAGTIYKSGSVLVDITEQLVFTNASSRSLSRPKTGGLTYKWLGKSLGEISVSNDYTLQAERVGTAVLSVTYQATATVYTLSSPGVVGGETDYIIAVHVTGDES
ncbi:MAG: hypothetical protein GQ570_03975 [Helicobacteraceae bacterium]|nr:hypothetical protein [Helicobacteraceae bacterium]